MAAAAQTHLNRHEIECGRRWSESKHATELLTTEVERLGKVLRAGQIFLLKIGLWTIGVLATAVGGMALYIFNHLSSLLAH